MRCCWSAGGTFGYSFEECADDPDCDDIPDELAMELRSAIDRVLGAMGAARMVDNKVWDWIEANDEEEQKNAGTHNVDSKSSCF